MGTVETLARTKRVRSPSYRGRSASSVVQLGAGSAASASVQFGDDVVVPFRRQATCWAPAEPQFGTTAAGDWQSDYSPELP